MDLRYRQAAAERLLSDPRAHPGLADRTDALVLFRLWIAPSFEASCAWSVLLQKGKHFLRRVVWDQRSLEVTSEPNTFAAEVPCEPGAWNPLLSELEKITLPAFIPVNAIGIDGVTYGVEVGAFMVSTRFCWWGEPPDAWKPLASWQIEAIRQLQALLPASTVPLPHEL